MNKTIDFFRERRGTWSQLKKVAHGAAWFHCASLGEFEQGRPVIEAFRHEYPQTKILLTFFSPSGYQIRKNYDGADFVAYLPLDFPWNVKRFLSLTQPSCAFFVKYEYWYFYLTYLKRRHIPTFLFSAIFRPSQPFFKWYGVHYRHILRCYSHLFVQNDASEKMLKHLIPSLPVTVGGDTRFDRVLQITQNNRTPDHLQALFCQMSAKGPLMIAGSTWPEDEKMLAQLLQERPDLHLVIAPHEIPTSHLKEIAQLFAPYHPVFYSSLSGDSPASRVCVIDTIGMLSSLYRYAQVCYIGGGFNPSGIHNTLEAATYGKPLLFGPNYLKFKEAKDLVEAHAACSYAEFPKLIQAWDDWQNHPEIAREAGEKAAAYVQSQAGATRIILQKAAPALHQ